MIPTSEEKIKCYTDRMLFLRDYGYLEFEAL
jgi:hypothetical protein